MSKRTFVLYSRTGSTVPFKGNLRLAGRLDIVYQCILTSLFASHTIRREVEFHAFLYGRPNPPLHLKVNGAELYDVRIDEDTWRVIINEVLMNKQHAGVSLTKEGIENFVKTVNEKYVLSENGNIIDNMKFNENPVFFLGDHIGLPKKFEGFLEREGAKKVSLGRNKYLAASCIDITNYILDSKSPT